VDNIEDVVVAEVVSAYANQGHSEPVCKILGTVGQRMSAKSNQT
jgi:hypothetical protein